MQTGIEMEVHVKYDCHFTCWVVNYGISNTVVLEIPQYTTNKWNDNQFRLVIAAPYDNQIIVDH